MASKTEFSWEMRDNIQTRGVGITVSVKWAHLWRRLSECTKHSANAGLYGYGCYPSIPCRAWRERESTPEPAGVLVIPNGGPPHLESLRSVDRSDGEHEAPTAKSRAEWRTLTSAFRDLCPLPLIIPSCPEWGQLQPPNCFRR